MSTIRGVWSCAHSIIRSARQIVNQQLKPLGLSSAEGNVLLHIMVNHEVICQEDLGDVEGQ